MTRLRNASRLAALLCLLLLAGGFAPARALGFYNPTGGASALARAGSRLGGTTSRLGRDAAAFARLTTGAEERLAAAASKVGEAADEVSGALRTGRRIPGAGREISLKYLKARLGRAGLAKGYEIAEMPLREWRKLERSMGRHVFGRAPATLDPRSQIVHLVRSAGGLPIIEITPRGLSSLEEAVKTVGHEIRHIQDIMAGCERGEAAARLAEEPFWQLFLKGSR